MKIIGLFIILFSGIIFASCKKKKIYHSFTDDERAFLVYNLGDIFKLKNENTGDTLIFEVTDKYDRYKDDYGPSLLPSRQEHHMEDAKITFRGTNNSTFGYISLYKDGIDQLSLGIDFPFSVVDFGIIGTSDPDYIKDTIVNGVSYKDIYI